MSSDYAMNMGDHDTDIGSATTDMGEDTFDTDMGTTLPTDTSTNPDQPGNDDFSTIHPKPGTTPENAPEFPPCPETEPVTIPPEQETPVTPEGEGGPPNPPEGWHPGGAESGW